MKLSLVYGWDCTPDAFWDLYFDPGFAIRLHLEALGSTSAEVLSQEGDLSSGLVRTLRYSQRPPMPGPVRKLFGEEVVTIEVSTYDPARWTTSFTMTPGTMADKTHIDGAIVLSRESGSTVERFSIDARVKIFGAGRDRGALHRTSGPRDAGEGGRVHARRARGLSPPDSGSSNRLAVKRRRRTHRTPAGRPAFSPHGFPRISRKALDRGARQHTCCGRHAFGRAPGRRTEPERTECVDARS